MRTITPEKEPLQNKAITRNNFELTYVIILIIFAMAASIGN